MRFTLNIRQHFCPVHTFFTLYICSYMHHFFPFKDQHLWLLPERCIFWEDQKALILSDSHFGKTGHFRKSGIPVPQQLFLEDMQRLVAVIQHYKPEQLIVVGDFFHSSSNKEHDFFARWRNDLSQLNILLVKGNHDILKATWYETINVKLYSEELLRLNNIAFVHDCKEIASHTAHTDAYFITGHFHPAVYVKTGRRQSISLPCFYFTDEYAILPAFSKFSGHAAINQKKTDKVFAIAERDVIEL